GCASRRARVRGADVLRHARCRGSDRGVDPPLARDALELVDATILEGEAGAGDEILNRLRDEHLARPGEGGDSRPGVDGDAADLRAVQLALARVDPRSNLHAELPKRVAGRDRTAHGPSGAVEGREKAVAGAVHLAAAEALELAPHGRVVGAEQVAP